MFVKFKEKLSKYESNGNNRSKLCIFTSEGKNILLITNLLLRETIIMANKMH